jgi:hypothetical protein
MPTQNDLIAEQKALHGSISRIVLAWSDLENALMLVLRSVLNEPSGAIASAIYFSPASAEVRIKLVDSAFDTLAGYSPNYPRIMEVWRRARGSVHRLKNTRNAVSHGQIITIFQFGKNHVRLTAPMFNFKALGVAHQKRQLPGLSSNDIIQSAIRMGQVSNVMSHFSAVCEMVHKKSETTLLETLLRAETDLKTMDF